MITVLAEKRPQAVIMAGVLGADRDRGGWFEGNGYCVTWCRGHLVRISTPLSASEWTGENLPIIPEKFVLEPVSKDAFGNEPDPEVLERLKVIRGLFSRSESLVNACDAGREGEGIFRNVYEYLECDKPFRRLWADSLTEGALRRAFEDLRPSSDYDLLARAARAREEADWLIGVNATRAATATADADRVLSAGRVQTAVLKMICDRFDEFNAFEAKPFWTIRGEFIKDGEDVRWRSSDRFLVEETANAVMEAVRETWELTVVSVDVDRKTSHAPLLHNLGSLQKEANVRLGMSAADCEKTVQSLYEKQLVSYPRTESRYLSQDEFDAVPEIVQGLENDPTYGRVARALSRRGLSTRCLDDRKMKEHPPLMVTDKKPWKLSAPERDVYNLILMRFLEAFCPSSVSDVTTVILEGAGREFVTRASVPVADGWKCVAKADRKPDLGPAEGVEEDPDGNPVEIRSSFPTLKEGDVVKVSKMELVKDETHPRPLLTDATLLSMMESAGKGGAGIGTAATRGAEIDILVDRGYVKRIMESRSLVPTQLGRDFYDAVRDMEICSVEMTSKWEASLESIKEGVCPDGLFGEQVRNYTKKMTGEILAGQKFETLKAYSEKKKHYCTACGAEIKVGPKGAFCDCGFKLWADKSGKHLTKKMIEELLDTGRTGKLSGFKRKDGTEFSAVLVLDRETGALSFLSERAPETQESGFACPKCGGSMKVGGKAVYCPDCHLNLYLEAYGAPLTVAEIRQLCENGSVVPAAQFRKKEDGKPYRATLVLDKEFRYALQFESQDTPKAIVICPKCGHVMKWSEKTLDCECGLKVWRTMFGRNLDEKEMTQLVEKGRVGPLDGFISKKGKRYSAPLVLGEDGKVTLEF